MVIIERPNGKPIGKPTEKPASKKAVITRPIFGLDKIERKGNIAMIGTIKEWQQDRGFGFVETEEGDMFLHYTGFINPDNGFVDFKEGEVLRILEYSNTQRGLKIDSCERFTE